MSDPVTSPGQGEPADAKPGDRISHYKIVGELGRGGMGIVYHAVDLNLGRDVAMKCAWPYKSADQFLRRRMMREARATSRILHPHIVPILETFEEEGVLWLVMEKVEGKSLRERLREGPLSPLEVIRCAEALAEGLGAAHRKGVLHRDVTPGNVLIGDDGRARLTDFGLVRFFLPSGLESEVSTETSSLTGDSRVVGTLPYMSPEQVLGKQVDPRSDLFSLGCVLYEACTATPPFSHDSRGELLDAILHREPVAISRLNYEVPEELDRIVRKSMAKRPDERYQTSAEMAADVRALRRRLESLEFQAAEDEAPGLARRKRRRVVAALSLTAIAASLVILFWALTGHEPPLPTGRPIQLTSDPGWEAEPALSPDGDFVAYSSDRSGNSDIWIMDLRGRSVLQLTQESATNHSPAWFPDGSALAFVSERTGSSSIWKMPRFPGPAVLILPDASDPAVSPDGLRIAFARHNRDGNLRIHVAPLADLGSSKVLTTDTDGLWNHHHPVWSPDGRQICYEAFRDLWLVDPDEGRPRALTHDHEIDRDGAWSADGRFIYFSSYRGGVRALWRVGVASGHLERMTLGTGPEIEPSIDRQGSRLAYSTYAGGATIAVFATRSGARSLWPGPRLVGYPTIDPLGGRIYYTSDPEGLTSIWVQDLDKGRPVGAPRPVCEQPGKSSGLALSPGGDRIVYYLIDGGKRDIWTVPAKGGVPARLTQGPDQSIHPAFSPDGKTLAFVSDRDGGLHVWTAPFTSDAPLAAATRVTSGPVTDLFPEWSPDGKTIAFTRNEEQASEVWTAPADGKGPEKRWTQNALARRVRWDPVSGGLLVSGTWGSDRVEVRRVSRPGAAPVPLAHPIVFGDDESMGDFSLTADGLTIALIQEDRRGDLWLLDARPGVF